MQDQLTNMNPPQKRSRVSLKKIIPNFVNQQYHPSNTIQEPCTDSSVNTTQDHENYLDGFDNDIHADHEGETDMDMVIEDRPSFPYIEEDFDEDDSDNESQTEENNGSGNVYNVTF